MILPLQGTASVLTLAQRDAGRAGIEMPCHAQQDVVQQSDVVPVVTGSGSPAQDDSVVANHLCCHMVLAFTYATPLVGSIKHPGATRPLRSLVTLYIPDSPDRPPRG